MFTILDYDAGNQTSVLRALTHLGIPATITADPAQLEAGEGIIFPGVGSAGQAMGVLKARGLDRALAHAVATNKPVLGICLGCQILLDHSEEDDATTLGIVHGQTIRFPEGLKLPDGSRAPIPHMGWNSVKPVRGDPLFEGIDEKAQFYFVHSYYVQPEPSLVIATTDYGMPFCSCYGRPGLWATQFHPEKSGQYGLRMLNNFVRYCRGESHAV